MSQLHFCFVIMPFRPELNYFYLYLQKYLREKFKLRVERGDHQVLTKPLMDKVRGQIGEADVLLADITAGNPNVFYEIGVAHALDKPVIFLTQDSPEKAPVDVRQFDFIHYDLQRHEEFLVKLDNAIQNVFLDKYRSIYDEAILLLRRVNTTSGSSLTAVSMEEFQSRVMRVDSAEGIFSKDEKANRELFLLYKILREVDHTSAEIIRRWSESEK